MLQNTFFTEHIWTTAPEKNNKSNQSLIKSLKNLWRMAFLERFPNNRFTSKEIFTRFTKDFVCISRSSFLQSNFRKMKTPEQVMKCSQSYKVLNWPLLSFEVFVVKLPADFLQEEQKRNKMVHHFPETWFSGFLVNC